MKKQIISLLMAALLLIGLLPVGASAADEVISGTFTYMPAFVDEPETEPFYYSDSWFNAPSTEQNTHMITMSAALAYASMEVVGSSYIKELYGKIGYADIQTYDMDTVPAKDTIGTAIAHKRIDGKEVVAVSIRGNRYGAEWASNLIAGVSGNIEGFDQASRKVTGRIRDYISAHGLNSVKLWIAGYSRAGSVADLTGVYINEHLAEFGTAAEDVYVYTYEAPRCCESDKQYPNIYCVKNKNDLLNYVYPASWGVYTNGREIILGSEEQIRTFKIDLLSEEKLVALDPVKMEDFSTELNLYHVGTLAVNISAMLEQHYPQTNLEMIKALDPYYLENGEKLYGDVDGDGMITLNDAMLIQQAGINLIRFTELQKKLGMLTATAELAFRTSPASKCISPNLRQATAAQANHTTRDGKDAAVTLSIRYDGMAELLLGMSITVW